MDPTTNRISLCSGGASETFILEFETSSTDNPSGNDVASSVDYGSTGDIYVSFTTYTTNSNGDSDAGLTKINKTGTNILWGLKWDWSGEADQALIVKITRNDNDYVYLGGSTGDSVGYQSSSRQQCSLKKLDPGTGAQEWATVWGSGGSDDIVGMDFLANGNPVITGLSYPWQSGMQIDSFNATTGANVWATKRDAFTTESATTVKIDSSDNVWWGCTDQNAALGDVWIAKVNNQGTFQQGRTISYSGDQFKGMDLDSNGDLIVHIQNDGSWTSTDGTINLHSPFVMKYDTSADSWLWAYICGQNNEQNWVYGICVDRTTDDSYSIARSNGFTGQSAAGLFVVKRNSSGTLVWARNFCKNNGKYIQTEGRRENIVCDGEYIIFVGSYERDSSSSTRPFLVKYPVDGSITGTFGDWTITDLSTDNAFINDTNDRIANWTKSTNNGWNVGNTRSVRTNNQGLAVGKMTLHNREPIS